MNRVLLSLISCLAVVCVASVLCVASVVSAAPPPTEPAPGTGASEPGTGASDPAGVEFFEKKVRPLLAQHCYECHSTKSDKEPGGRLLLDSPEGWRKGGEGGPAVIPRDVAESLLLKAVRYESLEMPPDGRLPAKSIKILESWIERGAPAPARAGPRAEHQTQKGIDWEQAKAFWAFQPPLYQPARYPAASHQPASHQPASHQPLDANATASVWARQPLDAHVAAVRDEKGLLAAPEAERHVWLRRVSYDLTGLPPTADEWSDFEQDDHPLAYERIVDRLLTSPHFGEQWGRHWLDVARYADSNGSDFNATFFNAWRYRNYVITSFNDDLPFDQFIREQIAGDLLPAENDAARYDQLVATTFLLAAPKMLSERDKPRLLLDVADEQIDTVGRVFQGLTLGCARCHDHKFDPIGIDDYYAMLGIFHSTESLYGESQQYVSAWRESDLPTTANHRKQVATYEKRVKTLEQQIATTNEKLKVMPAGEERGVEVARGVIVDDGDAEFVGNWKSSSLTKHFVGTGYRHDDKREKGAKSAQFTVRLPKDGEYQVRLSHCGGATRAAKIPVTVTHSEGATTLEWNQTKTPSVAGLFEPVGQFHFKADRDAVVKIETTGSKGFVIVDCVQFVPVEDLNTAEKPTTGKPTTGKPTTGKPTAEKTTKGKTAVERPKDVRQELKQELEGLKKQLTSLKSKPPQPLPKAMATREAEAVDDQTIRIRGVADRHGRIVPRGYLKILGAEGRQEVQDRSASGRRELADWITDRNNPLTARVWVNRIWSKLLGEGIVRSVDNFGRLGERPSHPQLLDSLAVDLMDNQWRTKTIVRRIVLSATYRQSSRYSEKGAGADPENRTLWRQNRKPLTAEQFRDSLLVVAGRIDLSQGKSPVAKLGRLAIDNSAQGNSGVDSSGFLRSVYLPVVRNDLTPFLVTFDFADPDMVVGKRPSTNVPAQALMLLNDPLVREMAEQLGKTTWVSGSLPQSTERLFLSVLGRRPTDSEIERIQQFVGDVFVGGAVEGEGEGGEGEGGEGEGSADSESDESSAREAWVDVAHALLASTEYRWLD